METEKKPLAVGEEAWDLNGFKYYIEHIDNHGRYIAAPFMQQEEYHPEWTDGTYSVGWNLRSIDKLYRNPPVQVCNEEVAKLRAEVEALRKEKLQIVLDARKEEADQVKQLETLKKYRGLETLQDFIDRKMTHFVQVNYSGVQILDWKQLDARDDDRDYRRQGSGIKLVTLFGMSNGDLQWRLANYQDGSGSSIEIHPCASYEDAVAKRAEILTAKLESFREYLVPKQNDQTYKRGLEIIWGAVEACRKHDVAVPEEFAQVHATVTEQRRITEIAKTTKQIADAREALAKLEAKIPS